MEEQAPRIPPGSRAELGLVNGLIARGAALTTGGRPPNLFTTFGRHRRLFRRWLPFASALMPGGRLRRRDTELVILRVAHHTGSEYEWRHHEAIATKAGLSEAEIERVREGPDADGWSERDAALLAATDELDRDSRISEKTWAKLRPDLSDEELIELCVLAGHYRMLAGMLNSLAVRPDDRAGLGRPPRALRTLRRLRRSRRRGSGT